MIEIYMAGCAATAGFLIPHIIDNFKPYNYNNTKTAAVLLGLIFLSWFGFGLCVYGKDNWNGED
jgi:hypothetical protein